MTTPQDTSPTAATAPTAAATTTALQGQALLLPLGLLMPSPTNPRKVFAQPALEELAATVAVHGVKSPLLARHNPAHQPGDGRHPFEIVAGERRWRACRWLTEQGRAYPHAGTVPVFVQQITDGEVLALQALENIQRQDLHPLEEADHYWLMTTHPREPITVDEVAAMIGKSPAYVYGRLGLRRLRTKARELFMAGKLDTSKAMKLAATPLSEADEAAAAAHGAEWGGEPMGARAFSRYINDRHTTQLATATWALTDPQLVPTAGACTDCPKRSDRQPQLFADVTDGDRCLDTQCWASKRQAMRDWRLDNAAAEGYRVLRGDAAAAVLLPKTHTLADGWHDLTARVPASMGDAGQTVEQAVDAADLPAQDITALQHPQRDTVLMCVATATLARALRIVKQRQADAAPDPKQAPMWPTPTPATATAKPPPPPPPSADWNPLDDLLAFAVLPANTKVQPAAVAMFRQRAIERVAAGLAAHRAAAEVRHRGPAMAAMLPRGLQGLLVASLAHTLRTSDAGHDTTLQEAAQLAGVATTPPAFEAAAVTHWALQLGAEDATAMAWALLALTPDAHLALPGTTWRSTVASAAGIAPAPLEAEATQVVDERLRLELLVASTINTAKGQPKLAAKKNAKPAAKAGPKPAAKAATKVRTRAGKPGPRA